MDYEKGMVLGKKGMVLKKPEDQWSCKRSPDSLAFTSGSSFEQTMIDRSPQCYIPSSVAISLLVPEKKIFEGFLPYMGMVAIFVM